MGWANIVEHYDVCLAVSTPAKCQNWMSFPSAFSYNHALRLPQINSPYEPEKLP
jgi:hypothetical protein